MKRKKHLGRLTTTEKIPSDRIEFTAGRDLILAPAQEGEPVNYFIYPYVEIDGKRVENVPTRFHFKRSST